MYPVGVLFGLGFDTATEVSLLVLAAGAAASQLPWYAFLALPILFAAGMSLFDSLDGGFMAMAYGWASARPVRTIYYSLTMTALSVAVALLVGGVQVMDLLGLTTVSLDHVGYLIVLMFAVTWAVAVAVWRLGRIEERWTASA